MRQSRWCIPTLPAATVSSSYDHASEYGPLHSGAVALGQSEAEFQKTAVAALAFQWFKQTPYMLDVGLSPVVGVWLHDQVPSLPWYTPAVAGLLAVAVIGNVAAIIRLVAIGRLLKK